MQNNVQKGVEMSVSVRAKNSFTGEIEDLVFSEGSATFAHICEELDADDCFVDKWRYYIVDWNYSATTISQDILPFVIIDDEVHWSVKTSETRLSDFVSTHGLDENDIDVYYYPRSADGGGSGGGGGGGFYNLQEMWQQVFYVLDYIGHLDAIIGVSGFAISQVSNIRKYLQKKFERTTEREELLEQARSAQEARKLLQAAETPEEQALAILIRPPLSLEDKSPGAVFSLVFSRRQWNAKELAELLDLSKDSATHLLKMCEYKWDAGKLMYVHTNDSDIVLEKLNNLRWDIW